MKEQPHYLDLLTREFFEKYYVQQRMSYPKLKEKLAERGYNISCSTLYSYAKKYGIGRNFSESKRNRDDNYLDYEKTYITDEMIQYVDGFLLGDGGIGRDKRSTTNVARFSCGVQYEEFCRYLMKPFESLIVLVGKFPSEKMKQGFVWSARTRAHPDIYKQYLRWYPENLNGKRGKQPPEDVRITPESVARWYLGDGSAVVKSKSIMLRLSTDGFSPEKVEFLAWKLRKESISCHRNNDNRIMIEARGIPNFFDFIGRTSPIKCYDYKYNLPGWRFNSKRAKEVADDLDISYNRLIYFIKLGKIDCYRLSSKGRPRFLPEHIEQVKELINSGELY